MWVILFVFVCVCVCVCVDYSNLESTNASLACYHLSQSHRRLDVMEEDAMDEMYAMHGWEGHNQVTHIGSCTSPCEILNEAQAVFFFLENAIEHHNQGCVDQGIRQLIQRAALRLAVFNHKVASKELWH